MEHQKIFDPALPVFIVGGGASLAGFDFSQLEGKQVIAINQAYKTCKSAAVLYSADRRFFEGETGSLRRFSGQIFHTCVLQDHIPRQSGKTFTSIDFKDLTGRPCNSGLASIFLARLLGAAEVVLLGFDVGFTLGKKNWHSTEILPKRLVEGLKIYDKMLKDFPVMAKELTDIKVVNTSLQSAIQCFPFVPMEEYGLISPKLVRDIAGEYIKDVQPKVEEAEEPAPAPAAKTKAKGRKKRPNVEAA